MSHGHIWTRKSTSGLALDKQTNNIKETSTLKLDSTITSQVAHVETDIDCDSGGNYSFQGIKQEKKKHHVLASPWFSQNMF